MAKTLKEILQGAGTGLRNIGSEIAYKWDLYEMKSKCISVGVCLVSLVGCYVTAGTFLWKPLRTSVELAQAKQEVLFRYGDVNKDGYVSQAEKDALFAEVLKGKGVRCISGEIPVYEDGQEVRREELTKWIKDYMTSKNQLAYPEKE